MTFALAMNLPDGVLLLGDRRRTFHNSDGSTTTKDGVTKLIKISEDLYAIGLGIEFVTYSVIVNVSDAVDKIKSPESLLDVVKEKFKICWEAHTSLYKGPNLDHIETAIIFAGIINNQPFFLQYSLNRKPTINTEIFKVLAEGGNGIGNELLQNIQIKCSNGTLYNVKKGPINKILEIIINTSRDHIFKNESIEYGVGGGINCVVIRNKFTNYFI
ncbi:MAG: hypothetical protein KJ737_06550 [Proteobacteria bacterium]|nr:hypothetical protein [Pseudomonadota bacterium]